MAPGEQGKRREALLRVCAWRGRLLSEEKMHLHPSCCWSLSFSYSSGHVEPKSIRHTFFSEKGLHKYRDLYSWLFSFCWWFQFKTVFSWKAVKNTWQWHHSISSHDMLVSAFFRMQKKGLFSQIIWFSAKYFYKFSAKKGSKRSNSSLWHYLYN